jgi:hypothetical protein
LGVLESMSLNLLLERTRLNHARALNVPQILLDSPERRPLHSRTATATPPGEVREEPDRRRNELPHALRYVSGMTAPPRFRVGLRVADVETARQFYGGLGFAPAAVIPDAQGELEPWGDRVFSALDPFGFEWEIAQPIPGAEPSDGAADAQAALFGSRREHP